jgi:hypothetical protein
VVLSNDGGLFWVLKFFAEILKQAYFPLPVKTDLSDLKRYNYSKRIFIPEKLDENKALNVIKEFTKDKALGLNKISNKVIKRVADAISALFIKIF